MNNTNYSKMILVSHPTNLLNNSILRANQEYAVEFLSKPEVRYADSPSNCQELPRTLKKCIY